MKTKKVKALSQAALEKILGGFNFKGLSDSKDCTSEVACGGSTTDTDEAAPSVVRGKVV